MTQEISTLFNRTLLRQNRQRSKKQFSEHDFLFHEIANRVAENVEFLDREFESVLEISTRDGYLSSLIKDKKHPKKMVVTTLGDAEKIDVINDDELLPFKEESFDLIVSNLNFHYINQIPQFLLQVRDLLKPGGVFIASFFGEENLAELAQVLHQTENEIYKGVSPRMPPTIDVKTAANLLSKAGFENPISDFAKIEVDYSDPMGLLKDLKVMGQGNILEQRSRKFLTKRFLDKICENYRKLHSFEDDKVLATFEVVTITGWKG